MRNFRFLAGFAVFLLVSALAAGSSFMIMGCDAKTDSGIYTLTTKVIPAGSGTVSLRPNKSSYMPEDTVTVTANPATGYSFKSWSGADESTEKSVTITMDGDQKLIAEFQISGIDRLSSMELVKVMGAGWNLGNTLDAHWNAAPWGTISTPREQETMWGRPVTTKAMIDKLKAEGFNTIRVPVTWYIFTGPAPEYKIADAWMNRVQEVVDYVIDNGMFCILNTHHEDYHTYSGGVLGWLRLYGNGSAVSAQDRQEMNARFGKMWEQIAERFKDYDERLIFEGLNEPRAQLGFDPPGNNAAVWDSIYSVLNELLQTFIDKVRASGGNNASRHLMVTPYFAQFGLHGGENKIERFVDTGKKKLKVNDPNNRLIVSLHYYEPYYFAGAGSNDRNSISIYDNSSGHIPYNNGRVYEFLDKLVNTYKIPVVMGETGALDKDNEADRVLWAQDYVKHVQDLGVPVVIWDDGGGFKLLDRRAGTWYFPNLTAALVQAANK
ncbi:MAG: cellulase family glycosylhydrolase [Treponema sp.]|jgi:endoglucanase|nr:cellulase family glycosylhydrolase [Treponema sp.]